MYRFFFYQLHKCCFVGICKTILNQDGKKGINYKTQIMPVNKQMMPIQFEAILLSYHYAWTVVISFSVVSIAK